MGEAKKRGTLEERKAAALEKKTVARALADDARRARLREEGVQAARVVNTGLNRSALIAALLAAGVICANPTMKADL
jgi:hypothetical protein